MNASLVRLATSAATRLSLLLLFIALAATKISGAEKQIGHLVIIGGGHRPESITKSFIELAGGTAGAKLVVIPLASEDTVETGRQAAEEFKAFGVTQVEVLPKEPELAARSIEKATGVYLSGGDQVRLVSALAGTRVVEAMHELWHRGGVIAGTSAGAAVMSALMITGEEHGIPKEEDKFHSIQLNEYETTNGFGFLTNAVVDQHFITRKRENRLFSVILEHPRLIGIGIDESTAVVAGTDLQCVVVGDRTAMIIDARQARRIHVGKDRHLAATDLRIHFLVDGDRFDLTRGRPVGRGAN